MIVYRELSSLVTDLGISARALYSVSNNISKHYIQCCVPKGNGKVRTLHVPDGFLKTIQRRIATCLLTYERISPFATAYRSGGSTLVNAYPHVGKEIVLKLDIRSFFDYITYPMVKERVFVSDRYSEANRILLSLLCVYKDALPQGAPTSPVISNIIMSEFDDTIGKWCAKRHIAYTRYCDDMTFSGSFCPRDVIAFVKRELKNMGLFLNNDKTVVLRNGQRKTVTGIVVNDKMNIPLDYRRRLRKDIYYCRKHGVDEHLRYSNMNDVTAQQYLLQLLGRINYVLSVSPEDRYFGNAKQWLAAQICAMNKRGSGNGGNI